MRIRPVIPRALARQDVEEAISYYLNEDAEQAALGFIDALEQAYTHIGHHFAAGSPRYAHELDLPGLRSWPLMQNTRTSYFMSSAMIILMSGVCCTVCAIFLHGCVRVTKRRINWGVPYQSAGTIRPGSSL